MGHDFALSRISLRRWTGLVFIQLILCTGALGQRLDYEPFSPAKELPRHARVVFVGNSLVEEASEFGILEWMLWSAWPDKTLTFRNLGWSGDTADGQARSYISRPPEPYDLLIQQIDTLNPSLVVVGYGGVEAYEGPEGLEAFGQSLDRLIRDLDSLGTASIFLSTIPQFVPDELEVDAGKRNDHLALYSRKIQERAHQHGKPFVDLFPALEAVGRIGYMDEGIHLNGYGYFVVGKQILETLGYTVPEWKLAVDARSGEIVDTSGVAVTVDHFNRTNVEFRVRSRFNPVLVDEINVLPQRLSVRGLKKGVYELRIDGEHILAATSSEFADGVVITQGPTMDMARDIQEMYGEINDLYFWAYRPLNRTYLVGFRRYEQGQNSYELGVNNLFIDRLEDQIIGRTKSREWPVWQIKRIK